MSRSQSVLCLVVAGVLMLGAGCARQLPANSLVQIQQDNVRQLSMACYWHHDGERIVAGPAQVFLACRRWAEQRVKARFTQSTDLAAATALTGVQ